MSLFGPNQAMPFRQAQGPELAEWAANREQACDLHCACLPSTLGCVGRFRGLAVADLVSR